MTEVVSVQFKDSGRTYYFNPGEMTLISGEKVIVETQSGNEFAIVTTGNHEVEDMSVVQPLKQVVRIANKKDIQRLEENKIKEKEAFKICENLIPVYKLDMKLVDVEYSFDSSRVIFFFTSDGRVDFRELVKDLASRFHIRIELRQIGVRDEAKMMGGIGICGQPYCCKRFLSDFQPVSIKMAKEQGLSLNPTKISGSCGRLMCCLKYEQDAYEYLNSFTPNVGATVKTKEGPATVIDCNLITGNLMVKPLEGDILPFKIHRDEVTIISRSKRKSKVTKNSTDE